MLQSHMFPDRVRSAQHLTASWNRALHSAWPARVLVHEVPLERGPDVVAGWLVRDVWVPGTVVRTHGTRTPGRLRDTMRCRQMLLKRRGRDMGRAASDVTEDTGRGRGG